MEIACPLDDISPESLPSSEYLRARLYYQVVTVADETATEAKAAPAPEPNRESPPPLHIFDRERQNHPWKGAFEEMRQPDPGRRWAVAANWRMDHRVHAGREEDDVNACRHFASVADADDWWEARQRYFEEEICCPDSPSPGGKVSSYSRLANDANRISTRIAGFDELVHVGSLNRLLRRAARSGRAAEVEVALRRLAGSGLPVARAGRRGMEGFDSEVSDLARALSGRGLDAVREIAGLLVDSLGDTEPPWWAGFVEEIRTVLDRGVASDLCAALGLGHRRPGEWLLIWRYTVAEAAPLYRPTVLEANDSPYHYPSPPSYSLGITMPLNPALAACREVLHRPLRGPAAAEHCTGEILYLESLPLIRDNGTLAALRARHRERLRSEIATAGLNAWIERHPELTP